MDGLLATLPENEIIPLRLRKLYESYGYACYRMGKFEPYDMYAENKSFLKSDGIITFTDAAGRLMALKPDVTLSIVKNAAADGSVQKLYYNENVFRIEQKGEEYREIRQMGLEYVGADSGYAEAEVLSLAAMTLAAISNEYSLGISHMGYISGLLMALELDSEGGERVLRAIRQKNAGELENIADDFKLSGAKREALLRIVGVEGALCSTLDAARGLSLCAEMNDAIAELESLCTALTAIGCADKLRLDFSVINNLDYYTGIVFRGYVRQSPRAVLAGGRYDNLLRRFDKSQPALGFALYLSELDRAFYQPREFDCDVLLIYGDAEPGAVALMVRRIIERGLSVRAERDSCQSITAKETIYFDREVQR